MTAATWAVIITQGIAIVVLAYFWQRTRDERDDARFEARSHASAFSGGPAREREDTASVQSAIHKPATLMPASDRRVLEDLAASEEAQCTPAKVIASIASVALGGNVHRVIDRMVDRGFLRSCALHRTTGWFITDQGREAVRHERT